MISDAVLHSSFKSEMKNTFTQCFLNDLSSPVDVRIAHYFQINRDIVVYADFSKMNPRFPFNVKIGLF